MYNLPVGYIFELFSSLLRIVQSEDEFAVGLIFSREDQFAVGHYSEWCKVARRLYLRALFIITQNRAK